MNNPFGYYLLNLDASPRNAIRVHFDRPPTLRQRFAYWLLGATWYRLPDPGPCDSPGTILLRARGMKFKGDKRWMV